MGRVGSLLAGLLFLGGLAGCLESDNDSGATAFPYGVAGYDHDASTPRASPSPVTVPAITHKVDADESLEVDLLPGTGQWFLAQADDPFSMYAYGCCDGNWWVLVRPVSGATLAPGECRSVGEEGYFHATTPNGWYFFQNEVPAGSYDVIVWNPRDDVVVMFNDYWNGDNPQDFESVAVNVSSHSKSVPFTVSDGAPLRVEFSTDIPAAESSAFYGSFVVDGLIKVGTVQMESTLLQGPKRCDEQALAPTVFSPLLEPINRWQTANRALVHPQKEGELKWTGFFEATAGALPNVQVDYVLADLSQFQRPQA